MKQMLLLASVAMAAAMPHRADAQTYKFQRISYQKGDGAAMSDINVKSIMTGGYFSSISSVRACFLYDAKTKSKTPLSDPNAVSGTECWGINDAGNVVGDYIDVNGNYIGYMDIGGTFSDVTPPGSTKTVVYGISNNNVVGGYYVDSSGNQYGFLYDGTTYTTVKIKGDTTVQVFGIDSAGDYTVSATNPKTGTVSFYYTAAGKSTPIVFPSAAQTAAHHLNDAGLVAATWIDSSSVEHGGVWNSTTNTYVSLDYPHSPVATIADGVNAAGVVVGRYESSTTGQSYGYRAVPAT